MCSITPHTVLTLAVHEDFRKDIRAAQAGQIIFKWKQQINDAPADAIVQKVVLGGHTYSRVAIVMITAYLKPLVSETIAVDLSGIVTEEAIDDEHISGLTALCDVFRECKLVEVNLSYNHIKSDDDNKNICTVGHSVLEAQKGTLKHLFLKNMSWSVNTMDQFADLLTTTDDDGTCVCDRLQTLHLHNELRDDGGAEPFKRILIASKRLVNVRYTGCRAFTEGSNALGDGFDKMGSNVESLKKLSLAGSSFGSGNGISLFVNAVSNCSRLTHINLRNTGLGIKGTEQLCEALCQAKASLVELDLSEHRLGPEGVIPVAKLLRSTVSTLKVFKFDGNKLTSLGVTRILKGLAWRYSLLEHLSLADNECGHIGANSLLKAFFPNLKRIDLDHNAFSSEDVKRLDQYFGAKLQEMDANDDQRDVDSENKLDEKQAQDMIDDFFSNISHVINLAMEPCGILTM